MYAHRIRRMRAAVAARAVECSRDRARAILLTVTFGVVLIALALGLAAAPALASDRDPAGDPDHKVLTGEYPVGAASRLDLSIPFGELKIEGTDGSAVRVRVDAKCDGSRRCQKFLQDLRLESSNRGGTLRVKLEGEGLRGSWNSDYDDESHSRGRHDRDHNSVTDNDTDDFTITVQVPRSLECELNMGAGEVEISGLREDLSIDMGAGDVTVRMPAKHVGSVDVNMAIGETTITEGGRTHEYARVLGGPVRWHEGKGDAGVEVNIGAGEVDVTLE